MVSNDTGCDCGVILAVIVIVVWCDINGDGRWCCDRVQGVLSGQSSGQTHEKTYLMIYMIPGGGDVRRFRDDFIGTKSCFIR